MKSRQHYIRPVKLGIEEKLKNDKNYRKAFFRASASDNIAWQIRKLRNARGFKQAELASLAGMKQSALSRIEQSEYSSYTLTTLLRIADALNARVKVTFELAEDVIKEYRSR